MKKKLLFISSFFLFSIGLFAQQGDGGTPISNTERSALDGIDTRTFSEPDIEALRAEDAIVDAEKSGPWRFGYNNYTDLNLINSGTWTDLSDGGKVWQLIVSCKNALTINLTFANVAIPAGNEMYVFNPEKDFVLGKFTARHLYEGQLGTELVPGEITIIEYYVSPENLNTARGLTLATVTHGYRTALEYQTKAFGSSGSCNMNSICPDGDPIRESIRATVMLVSGSNGFCTGSLINNTNNDGIPYVLTANHCYSNPTTWIFRFNWASASCPNPGSSPSFSSLSGAAFRARRTPSDFALVEITGGLELGTIPMAFNAFFPGWDNSDTPPSSAHCVHHPSGDIKKISFDDNTLSSATSFSSPTNGTWRTVWDRNTTTEGGSSGSPLFDQNGRIVGQLWGGGASCSNLSSPDYYGKLSYSWEPSGSSNAEQLKYWLDPNSTGVTTLDGFDPIIICNSTFASSTTIETCFGDDTGDIDVSFLTGVTSGATFDLNDGNGPQASGIFTDLPQGNYTITVIDGEACATQINITITGPSNLTIGAGTSAEITPNSGAINMTIYGGTGGYTISWTGPNGFTSSSEDLTGLVGGDYFVTIVDANGCTYNSNAITVNSFVTSGLEELTADAISVYPNPSDGKFNVLLNGTLNGKFTAVVNDLSGRVVLNKVIENENFFSIDLSGASNGTYILQLSNDDVTVQKRIVLKK